MTAEELFKAGRLDESLSELQGQIRKAPSDPKLRIFLTQLLMINGAWSRAHNQLKVLSEMSAEAHLLAAIFRPLIELEAFRSEVFAGQRTPLIFGEPSPFIGNLVKALSSEASDAANLRTSALEEAPARKGRINGQEFEWIMDADERLGPVFEVAVERKYYWMGIQHLRSITTEAPADLRDIIWLPAEFELVNGGKLNGFLYVRYPGTEEADEIELRLSKVTEWKSLSDGATVGLGQRLLATDKDDFSILDLRHLEFDGDNGSTGK